MLTCFKVKWWKRLHVRVRFKIVFTTVLWHRYPHLHASLPPNKKWNKYYTRLRLSNVLTSVLRRAGAEVMQEHGDRSTLTMESTKEKSPRRWTRRSSVDHMVHTFTNSRRRQNFRSSKSRRRSTWQRHHAKNCLRPRCNTQRPRPRRTKRNLGSGRAQLDRPSRNPPGQLSPGGRGSLTLIVCPVLIRRASIFLTPPARSFPKRGTENESGENFTHTTN